MKTRCVIAASLHGSPSSSRLLRKPATSALRRSGTTSTIPARSRVRSPSRTCTAGTPRAIYFRRRRWRPPTTERCPSCFGRSRSYLTRASSRLPTALHRRRRRARPRSPPAPAAVQPATAAAGAGGPARKAAAAAAGPMPAHQQHKQPRPAPYERPDGAPARGRGGGKGRGGGGGKGKGGRSDPDRALPPHLARIQAMGTSFIGGGRGFNELHKHNATGPK